jgi:hypothetical protein
VISKINFSWGMALNMFDNLHDIIIITTYGKVMVSRIKHPKMQEQLLGMFFSALNTLTQVIFNLNFTQIEMNAIRFDLLHKKNIIFIGTSPKNVPPELAQKDLELLADYFFSKYSQETLATWSGAFYIFADFEKELNIPNITFFN